MGQGRFGHDRILSGVIVCHVVGNNGVFPERGSRGPCVGFWVPGSIWQRMWYFCAKFLWIKGVFYHGLCVIIYAGRIVPCLHWYLIRVIGRMTSLEWFSIWETSNNIINFNDVRKRLWKLVSMMMFSPCVFCVLPCVTSTFTVSKLARIIKQASRVGVCERVFTPVRWRQVWLSCIKWRSTFFLYFFVRPSFGQGGRLLRQLCCWVGVSAQRTHHAKTTSLWRYHHVVCPLGWLVRPAGLPGVGSLWASLRPRCEVDVDEPLVEGTAGGGAGRQGSPGLPVEWQVSRVGGLGNKGSSCPGRILSLSAFVTVCDSSEAEWRHYE